MTINIADNAPRANYTATSGQTVFTVSFEFFDEADLTVYINGTETSAYTVTGGDGSTGTVTLTSGATAGDKVAIVRDVAIERTTDFTEGAAISRSALNEQLDKLTAQIADIDDRASRSLQLNDHEVAVGITLPATDDRKGKVLGFNATTGNVESGPEIADVQSLADVSADIATLADIEDGTDATDAIQAAASVASDISTVSGISANVTTVAGISSDVTAVASDATDIGTVATNIASVNTVATNIADVITVANDLNEAVSEVVTVADDLNEAVSEIDTVATSISNVDTVGTNIADVNTVAGISANVTTVAGISADTSTVAGISANVTTVAGISSDVTAVAADATDIGTVATNISNVNAVAGNATNINSVASNATNINAVAADAADIGTVSGISANVTTVAGLSSSVSALALISSDITTVAGISANVTTVAGDTANIATIATNLNGSDTIGTVAGSISNVNAVGGAISDVSTVASNLTDVQSFANTYRIGATDPTTSLDEGDLFYNTTSNTLKVYTGSAWEQGVTAGSGFLPLTGGGLTGNLTFGDNNKAIFGAGSDLAVFSNGTDSFIQEYTTGGHLYIDATNLRIRNRNDNTLRLQTSDSGAVDLYYNGSTKLATTSTGVDITGTLTSDGLTVDGNVGIGTSSPSAKLDVAETDSVTYSSSAVQGDLVISRKNTDNTVNEVVGLQFNVTGWSGSTTGVAGISAIQTSNASSADLAFQTRSDGTIAERMRIDSSGNVDIGSTGGGVKLAVAGAVGPQNGTAAAPTHTFYSDTNTGMFRATVDTLGFSTAGAERMRIDSSGNLLVGKTASNSIADDGIQLSESGQVIATNTLATANSGQVAIFSRKSTDGPILDLRKDGTTVGSIASVGGSDIKVVLSSDGDQYITGNATSNYMTFSAANQERMRIDSSGNLLVGLTSISDATSRAYGNAFSGSSSNPNWKSWGSGAHTHAQFRNGTSVVGSITTTSSATTYNTSSDHRLKENVVDLTGATTRLKQLEPKRFNFIADADTTVDGFIAHEVQSVVPEAITGEHNEVDGDGNPVYQGID